MNMKIVITNEDVQRIPDVGETSETACDKTSPISLRSRLALAPLVLILPALCIAAMIVHVVIKSADDQVRLSWHRYLSLLLMISGFVTSIAVGVAFMYDGADHTPFEIPRFIGSIAPLPEFPTQTAMEAREFAEEITQSFVGIIPEDELISRSGNLPLPVAQSMGTIMATGMDGYYILTGRSGIDGQEWRNTAIARKAVVLSPQGNLAWGKIIGRHKKLDMALIWVAGKGNVKPFRQPVADDSVFNSGERLYLVEQPRLFASSIVEGAVSGNSDNDMLPFTMSMHLGNAKGLVYDSTGRLLGWAGDTIENDDTLGGGITRSLVSMRELMDQDAWNVAEKGGKSIKEFWRIYPSREIDTLPATENKESENSI